MKTADMPLCALGRRPWRTWTLVAYTLPIFGNFLAVSVQALDKPNVILFLVDDMGWADCGAYGSTYYETPHMDRFALQSLRFTQAYAQPLCSPTRASILTGVYPTRHGVTSASGHMPPQPPDHRWLPDSAPPNRPMIYPESKNYLDPAFYTLAEALKDAGYRTAHIGKWHLGLTRPYWPDQHGFEVVVHAQPSASPPSYFSPYGVAPDGTPSGRHHVGTITDGPPGEYITDRLTDEAIRFIEQNRDRPFFLNLWHYAVHGPWGHKEEYTRQFAQKKDPRGLQGNPIMASMLKSVDESLGRILTKLDELGLSTNTIVIFFSDNGGNVHSMTPEDRKSQNVRPGHPAWERFQDWRKWAGDLPPTTNAPLRSGKGRLYEGGIRVPLMVRWPGHIPAGAVSDAIVGCIDLYPTIVDLCGIQLPPNMQRFDGKSLAPILLGTGTWSRTAYFIWFPHLVPGVAVRSGDWKLIRRFEPRPDEYEGLYELFNLRDDIGETTNLASRFPEKVRELDTLIERFMDETGAIRPKPNPAYRPRPDVARPHNSTEGLVPRGCELIVTNGVLRIVRTGSAPFLGIAGWREPGPYTLELRARCSTGETGTVRWSLSSSPEFDRPGHSVEFQWPSGPDWHEVSFQVPIRGLPRVVRVYLPPSATWVELTHLHWRSAHGPVRSWDFCAPSR